MTEKDVGVSIHLYYFRCPNLKDFYGTYRNILRAYVSEMINDQRSGSVVPVGQAIAPFPYGN